jgi:hypothetical protein
MRRGKDAPQLHVGAGPPAPARRREASQRDAKDTHKQLRPRPHAYTISPGHRSGTPSRQLLSPPNPATMTLSRGECRSPAGFSEVRGRPRIPRARGLHGKSEPRRSRQGHQSSAIRFHRLEPRHSRRSSQNPPPSTHDQHGHFGDRARPKSHLRRSRRTRRQRQARRPRYVPRQRTSLRHPLQAPPAALNARTLPPAVINLAGSLVRVNSQ